MNGDWLMGDREGRLGVYWPSGDAVLCRTEGGPGGGWTAARRAGGEQRLHPVLALGQGADGYAHLVSWRPAAKGDAGLVHSTHFRARLAPLDWVPIGHPDKKGSRTGTPAVAVDRQGRAHVFVRNDGGGVSTAVQKEKGGWEPWRDLGGHDVQDGLVAVTAESGLIELYAAVTGGILHWRQEEAGGAPRLTEALEAPVRPGTLNALATSPAYTTLFYADDSGILRAWRPGAEPTALLPAAGPGPVAAVRCTLDGHDCTLLAQRTANSRVAFAAYPTELESAGAWWAESGPLLADDTVVSLAADEHGRTVAAALSPSSGRLLMARRKDEPGLALDAWREV